MYLKIINNGREYEIKSMATFGYPLFSGATKVKWHICGGDVQQLYLIEQHWNSRLKVCFWDSLKEQNVCDILRSPKFNQWFDENAQFCSADRNYREEGETNRPPYFKMRNVMWALGMRRPKKEIWES